MDGFGTKAESDLLQQLFRENNEIRARFNALSRELYDKSTLYEDAEEEIRELKQKLEQRNVNVDNKTRPGTSTLDKSSKRPQSSTTSHSNPGIASLSKQLEEALLILDRRNNELQQLQSELDNSKATILQYQSGAEQSEREIRDLEEQVAQLRREQGELIMLHSNGSADSEDEEESTQDDAMTPSRKSKRPKQSTDTEDTSAVVTNLKKQLVESEETVRSLRKQVVEVATDANMRHNELQGELQGMEALIDSVRSDYAAFINTTRLEHETYKATQAAQYASLKSQLEAHRASDFAERKRLTKEYEGVLYSMQAEFEEYRAMSEFLFNAEVAKLEEELTSQASRYEQEILYVIQAKDKFYADMMVAKDAKIMNLIEGSDLQTLMQKHEVDMENLRRDHIRELERLKSDQESEAKSLIQLLQRQNSSLENKCEKLQAHIKVLESRIKESQSLLDARAKNYAEKEDSWVKREKDYEGKISEMLERNATLVREKEHLRHKVIRLNLDAKGEAGNGIDSMLKRISRDTIDLQNQYTELSIKYEDVSNDLQSSSKRLKEKDRFILYLEKEVSRRNEEYVNMTQTFEHFLSSRARATRRERAKHLHSLQANHNRSSSSTRDTFSSPSKSLVSGQATRDPKSDLFNQGKVVKIHIPEPTDAKPALGGDKSKRLHHARRSSSAGSAKSGTGGMAYGDMDKKQSEIEETERMELERGFAYLRRFKTLSRAFTTGEFRRVNYVPELDGSGVTSVDAPGPWTMISLYSKLRDTGNTTDPQHDNVLYGETPQDLRLHNLTNDVAGQMDPLTSGGDRNRGSASAEDGLGALVKPVLYSPTGRQPRRDGSAEKHSDIVIGQVRLYPQDADPRQGIPLAPPFVPTSGVSKITQAMRRLRPPQRAAGTEDFVAVGKGTVPPLPQGVASVGPQSSASR